MPITDFFRRKGTRTNYAPRNTRDRTRGQPAAAPGVNPPAVVTNVQTERTEEQVDQTQIDATQQRNERDNRADRQEGQADQQPQQRVVDNEALTNPRTTTTIGTEKVYDLFWANQLHRSFEPVTISRKAHFIPNAMALQEIMLQASPIVGRSAWLQKHESTYNEYAVFTGMSILYYIQILRAKKAASDLTGVESSLLNRFFNAHPEESIDIPAPFFPFFNTIIATELEDRKYDWIVPTYGDFTGRTSFEATSNFDRCIEYIRPQVPYMLAMLGAFASETRTDLPTKLDDDLVYRPVTLDRTANTTTRIFNADRRYYSATVAPRTEEMILATCGTSYPFRFWNFNSLESWRRVRETDFFNEDGVEVSAVPARTVRIDGRTLTLLETRDISRIDKFLNMEKEKGMGWFNYLKEQISIFAGHWKDKYNLSNVQTAGGLESSIIAKLRSKSHRAISGTDTYMYTNHILDVPHQADIDWYIQYFKGMTATFKTTRAGTVWNEERQALTFATNSMPPVHSALAHRTNYRFGAFFDHSDETTAAHAQLYGSDDDIIGKAEMFTGWANDVFARIFSDRPLSANTRV